MKSVILAGGMGSRLAELTEVVPKPMVEIGGRPILWHIMKHFEHYGHREFVVALGYKGESIKQFFTNYRMMNTSVTVELASGEVRYAEPSTEDWTVHLVDTGLETSTGGRLAKVRSWLDDETFMLTYGDGVADIDLGALVELHRSEGRIGTVTAVRPPSRFGGITLDGAGVSEFVEKPHIAEGWINGGFMLFEPGVFDYIADETVSLERDVLQRLAADGQLAACQHVGFWQCMDTLRDRQTLESLWQQGDAPWRLWG